MSQAITPEMKQEFGQLATDLQTKLTAGLLSKEEAAKMNKRLDELETKMFRPNIFGAGGNAYSDQSEAKGYRDKPEYKAFSDVLKFGAGGIEEEQRKLIRLVKKGNGGVGPDETKILTATDDTGGGYLAPPEYVTEIIKGIILYSPVRTMARVRQTSQRSVRVPKRTGTFAAAWVSEIGTRAETTGLAYGLEELFVHELYALVDISNQDLEDSAFDLNAEIQQECSEQFAKAEGAAFVNGTAVTQPEGFMTNAAIASDVSGSAASLTYNGFVTCAHNLKSFYAQRATWGMNRKTIGLTRSIVDGSSRPIWMPFGASGLDGSNPPTILGIPYQELPDMPDVAASSYPVVIADFSRGYMIVDRINIEIQRDPFTQNTKGVTRFIARKRVGGQVVLAEAFR